MTASEQAPSSSSSSSAEVTQQIKALIQELPDERADAARLDELRRIFCRLVSTGKWSWKQRKSNDPMVAKWQTFLCQNYERLVQQLCQRIQLGKRSAIRCMWGVIAGTPVLSGNGQYQLVSVELLKRWIQSMTNYEEEMDQAMRHMVEAEFLQPHRDVQYYAIRAISQLAHDSYERQRKNASRNGDKDQGNNDRRADKLLQLLMMIPVSTSQNDMDKSQYMFPPPKDATPDASEGTGDEDKDEVADHEDDDDDDDDADDDDDSEEDSKDEDEEKGREEESTRPAKRLKTDVPNFSFQQHRCFRREYEKAWLSLLKLSLSTSSLKRALQFLPIHVLPNIAHPLQFSDFFMQAYNDHDTGVIGVLALDGLFLLMTQYELEYPDFYKQLYRLMTPRSLFVKYRIRFFHLLTQCLTRNEMLPAHLVAAFIKRLCRCALSAPPSGILFVLALVSNLLRKHPECACLIHRDVGTEATTTMDDGFVPSQDDPTMCRALQSSLWELAALERHYHPAVVTLAKSIGTEAESKVPLHNMLDDFSTHTYKTLFDQERKKKSKTALAFQEPPSLFTDKDVFCGILDTGDGAK